MQRSIPLATGDRPQFRYGNRSLQILAITAQQERSYHSHGNDYMEFRLYGIQDSRYEMTPLIFKRLSL